MRRRAYNILCNTQAAQVHARGDSWGSLSWTNLVANVSVQDGRGREVEMAGGFAVGMDVAVLPSLFPVRVLFGVALAVIFSLSLFGQRLQPRCSGHCACGVCSAER